MASTAMSTEDGFVAIALAEMARSGRLEGCAGDHSVRISKSSWNDTFVVMRCGEKEARPLMGKTGESIKSALIKADSKLHPWAYFEA